MAQNKEKTKSVLDTFLLVDGFLIAILAVFMISYGLPQIQLGRRYEQGQAALAGGEYARAAQIFKDLDKYGQSRKYARYAWALGQIKEEGDVAGAQNALMEMQGFEESVLWARYAQGMIWQGQEEGWADAYRCFSELNLFEDSQARARDVGGRIRERGLSLLGILPGEPGAVRTVQGELDRLSRARELLLILENGQQGARTRGYIVARRAQHRGEYAQAARLYKRLGAVWDSPRRMAVCTAKSLAQRPKHYEDSSQLPPGIRQNLVK